MAQHRTPCHCRTLLLLACLVHALGRVACLYHTSSEVLHWFSHTSAKHPSLLRFKELKEHHTRTLLPLATITTGADASPSPPKPVVLFVFGEHAREVITSEVAVWMARMLVDNSSAVYSWPELGQALERAQLSNSSTSNSTTNSSGSSSVDSSSSTSSSSSSSGGKDWPGIVQGWVQEVLEKLEVQIIPIEALDSRRQVEEGNLCVRKTARNVDLNRNWPFAWHKESPSDEQYGGPGPFSEPQSRLVKQVVDASARRLLGYINVHSGEWALYTPWDSKPAYGTGMPADMPDLVSKVGRVCDCKAGPAGAVSGYLAFGSSMDYVYVHKQVPYPLTVEVYGGGDIGKLRPGEVNKPLTEFQVTERPKAAGAASPPLHRRALQQQQQQGDRQQRPHYIQQQQKVQQKTQQQHEQQQPGLVVRIWSRLSRRLLQQPSSVVYGPQQQAAAAAAGSRDGAAAVGFSWEKDLGTLRQQVLLQLTEQQLQSQSLAAGSAVSSQQQQQQEEGDAILSLVAKADPQQQSCFKAFNPSTEDAYRRVVADWLAAFLVMLKHMADSEAAKDMAAAAAAAGGAGSSIRESSSVLGSNGG